jgi:tetratricopeptide (TPR) repeat protein
MNMTMHSEESLPHASMHEEAWVIFKQLGDRSKELLAQESLVKVLYVTGQYKRSVKMLEGALTLSRELGDKNSECTILVNLSAVYFTLDQKERSLELSKQSLAIATQVGDKATQGIALGNIGGALQDKDICHQVFLRRT